MSYSRLFVLIAVLSLYCTSAFADNPLPQPRVMGPTQVNNRSALTLQFSYPAISWSYQNFWHLYYWTEYWHCQPGKDSPPTDIDLQTNTPWPGKTNPCSLDDSHYNGLSPHMNVGSIPIPKSGGIPETGFWHVRVRLAWVANQGNFQPQLGPWSNWYRVAVVQSFNDAVQPPRILEPADKQVFTHQDVNIRVMATSRHPNLSQWKYTFDWQRAKYYTKADSANATPHPGGFPSQIGQASPFGPWSTRLSVYTLAESAVPSILHIPFTDLRSGHRDFSYIYRFRVRERLNGASGPWSEWRSFIVTEPLQLKLPQHPTIQLK